MFLKCSGSHLIWSRLMLSVAYCDQIAWVPLTKLYSRYLYNKSVIVIILLMLSLLLGPKVITLSGFLCILILWTNFSDFNLRHIFLSESRKRSKPVLLRHERADDWRRQEETSQQRRRRRRTQAEKTTAEAHWSMLVL